MNNNMCHVYVRESFEILACDIDIVFDKYPTKSVAYLDVDDSFYVNRPFKVDHDESGIITITDSSDTYRIDPRDIQAIYVMQNEIRII